VQTHARAWPQAPPRASPTVNCSCSRPRDLTKELGARFSEITTTDGEIAVSAATAGDGFDFDL